MPTDIHTTGNAYKHRSSQSHLRAGIGLALLLVTLGTQLLWVLTTY